MFFRILKKDLKRKKTMNVILLLFVILCSMFAAASVNNIIAVTGGIDNYFEKAGMPDLMVDITTYTETDAGEKILALPSVQDVKKAHALMALSSKQFTLRGEELTNFYNPAVLYSDGDMAIDYFDEDNNVIGTLPKGSFYASKAFLNDLDIEKGDRVDLTIGSTTVTLEYLGRFKGAQIPSQNASNPYLIIDQADYDLLDKEPDSHFMFLEQLYINGADEQEIRDLISVYDGVYLSTREETKGIYLYDMIAAYIMMIISIVLMLTAFVVLRYSIGFTIAEEFREIGVMKAVGINNSHIRSLYIVKYLAIAVVGAAIGFLCSLPLTNMMLATVSENMVLGSEHSRLMGLLSAVAVVVIILLFCYTCTRRVNKLSPIDAVRSGQTGERYGKRSLMHLGRSRLPATGFMALNDVLSAPKQFSVITVVFVLCLLMMTLMSTFSLTLQSDKIYRLFDIPRSDATILDTAYMGPVFKDQSNSDQIIKDTEQLLRDNGMPGTCTMSISNRFPAKSATKEARLAFNTVKGHTDDVFLVDEGTAPKNENEVALTASAFQDLDVEIGDRITAEIDGKEYEFIITGRYPTFSTHAAMLCPNFDLGHSTINASVGVQIKFDGDPDEAQIRRNIEKLKKVLDTDKVYTTSEMIKYFTGISDTLDTIKLLMMILTVIVTAMIAILMERSFISKEKSEIALMKAVGIKSGSIIAQHTLRFVIVAVLACVISSAVLLPIANFSMNRICLLIGDVSGIKCTLDPVEVFVLCPAIIIGITGLGAFLTALYTRTVTANDTASIE